MQGCSIITGNRQRTMKKPAISLSFTLPTISIAHGGGIRNLKVCHDNIKVLSIVILEIK